MITSQKVKCSRGWEDRCAYAHCESCRCACGGQNHGVKRARFDKSMSGQLSLFGDTTVTRDESKERGHIVGYLGDRRVYIHGKQLDPAPSLKLRNHSPDGFAWGYGGSGPAQLALAILLSLYDKQVAQRFYQNFKWDVIANLDKDQNFSIPVQVVHDSISKYEYLNK